MGRITSLNKLRLIMINNWLNKNYFLLQIKIPNMALYILCYGDFNRRILEPLIHRLLTTLNC